MPARISWYKKGSILLFEVSDPLSLDEFETAGEEVWALAAEVREPVDMIIDYRKAAEFPRGVLPIVRDAHFSLPTLGRVALVGREPMVEMMFATLTRKTYRPDPTVHMEVEDAAETLEQMAADDKDC